MTIAEKLTTVADNMSKVYNGSINKFISVRNGYYLFYEATNLDDESCRDILNSIDFSKITTTEHMYRGCTSITTFPKVDFRNVTNTNRMFDGCSLLTTIEELDLRSLTDAPYMFRNCTALTTIKLKNIGVDLIVGSTTYGQSLTKECLIDLIRELRNTGSSLTLTMGSTNLAKLSDVYVKTVAITDEMRAADDLIAEKLPFEVCQSTDEGAQLITEYVLLKNWAIK